MSTRHSAIDIAGIILGVVVILVVIGSMALIARSRIGVSSLGVAAPTRSFWEQRLSGHGALREEKDELVAGDFTAVEIRNIAGSIGVHQGAANGVSVHSVKTAMFPAAMDGVTVDIEKQGSRLLVEERHTGGFFMSAGSVSFDITVPPGVKIIEARSVSGSITVRDVAPGIDQSLSTISGSITTSKTANLSASSTSGSIQFSFDGSRLDAHTVSGSIQGRIESLDKGDSASMRTVSGSVDVEAFAGLNATVSLHTVSGGILCELPVTGAAQKRNSVEGWIGNGAGRMEITTTSGPITIRKM